ncbi:MAG TPA: hypothetical protein VJN94_09455 [Candidatus Binataceae bacterium]|nr:hypothetical protein [Candidatus Binataceae bacterium]
MRIDFLFVADAAEAIGGKIFVLGGGWDVCRSPIYPALNRLAIVAAIMFNADEVAKTHRGRLSVSEVNGHDLIPPAEFEVHADRGADLPSNADARSLLALNLNLQIPGPGAYEVRLTIGEMQQATRFYAKLITPKERG